MAATPSARDRILDAFEELLIEHGERASTLEAVARSAGVSKGGLLYHFASKDALVEGVIDRLTQQVQVDLERMRAAPAGPVDYFIRTSVSSQSPLDRTIIAVARLAQGANPRAREALHRMQADWLAIIEETVRDPAVARAVMLLGDGMYYNSALLPSAGSVIASDEDMDRLLAVVADLIERRS
jgi:AcrR family transcriptional regulator